MIDKDKQLLIFDFDGTIADTFEHIIENLSSYMGDFAVELSDKDVLNDLRSLSAEELFKEFKIPKILIPFIARKIQKQLGKNIYNINPFDDVLDEIRKLKKKYEIGILTSNSKKNVEKFLEKEKVSDLFSFIYAEPNLFGKHKVLNKLVKKYKLDKNNIVYIGDEARDVTACNKAGIKIISVGWGFNSEVILTMLNGDNYIDNPKDLKKKINEVFST